MPSPDVNANWREQHPDEGLLHEWLDEQLGTDEAARVAAHVSSCHECRARVAEAHGLIAASRRILSALDNVPGSVIPSSAAFLTRSAADVMIVQPVVTTEESPRRTRVNPREFRWRRWGAVAAVLVLAVTGVFVRQNDRPMIALPSQMAADRRAERADTSAARERTVPAPAAAPAPMPVQAPPTVSASANEPAQRASSTPVTAQKSEARNAEELPSLDAGKSLAKAAAKPLAVAAPASAPPTAPVSGPPAASANAPLRATNTIAVGGVARGGQGAAAATGDTLSARLEAERKRRMTGEAVAADANSRPRIDAVGVSQTQAFSARAKTSAPNRDSLAETSALKDKAAGALAPVPFDSLALTREPCFGSCPAYELMVDGTGRVRYQSHIPGDTSHAQQAQLTAGDLARLQRLLQQAHVETLQSYMPGSTTCGLATTDMPSLRMRVFERGRWYTVEQYLGCSAGTKVLPDLARQIDVIVGTQRWLPSGYRLN